jgi:hypothetical protein
VAAVRVPAQARGEVKTQDRRGTVLAVDGGALVHGQSLARYPLSEDAKTDLAALLQEAEQIAPDGPLTLVIGADMHRGYSLPKSAPRNTKPPKPFAALTNAGWHRPFHPGEAPKVTKSAALARSGRDGQVRITPALWLGADDFPRFRTAEMRAAGEVDSTAAPELAYRLARFADAVGFAFEATSAGTGMKMLRALVEASAKRAPKWQGSAHRWPVAHEANLWERPLSEAEQGCGYVHPYDAVKNYLPAYGAATVARDDLMWFSGPMFDPKRAGFWLITVPEWPHPLVPAPVPDVRPGAQVWVTTAVVALYVELGTSPEVHEAWTADAVAFEGLRDFTSTVRDVLTGLEAERTADPDELAVRAAVKGLYHTVHGKLRNDRQGIIRRPDWGHAVRDAAWTGLLRKIYQSAGIMDLPKRVQKLTGTVRTDRPQFPVKVKTDEVTYVSANADGLAVRPEALEIGTGLGQFKAPTTKTLTEWTEDTSNG